MAGQARRPSMDEVPGAGSTRDQDSTWTRKGGQVNECEVADTLIS